MSRNVHGPDDGRPITWERDVGDDLQDQIEREDAEQCQHPGADPELAGLLADPDFIESLRQMRACETVAAEPTNTLGPNPVGFDGDLHVRLAETIQKHIPGVHADARDYDPDIHVSNLDELVDALLLAVQVMPVWREVEALQANVQWWVKQHREAKQDAEQAEARAATAGRRIRAAVAENQKQLDKAEQRAERAEARLTDHRGPVGPGDTVVILRQRGTYDGDAQYERITDAVREAITNSGGEDEDEAAANAVLDALREEAATEDITPETAAYNARVARRNANAARIAHDEACEYPGEVNDDGTRCTECGAEVDHA